MSHGKIEFDCQRESCDEHLEVNLDKVKDLPGFGLCSCGYGYIAEPRSDDVTVFDGDGDEVGIVDFERINEPKIYAKEDVGIGDSGAMDRTRPRNARRARIAADAAQISSEIPLPADFCEEIGLPPEAFPFFTVAKKAVPPALYSISTYYEQLITERVDEFGDRPDDIE